MGGPAAAAAAAAAATAAPRDMAVVLYILCQCPTPYMHRVDVGVPLERAWRGLQMSL